MAAEWRSRRRCCSSRTSAATPASCGSTASVSRTRRTRWPNCTLKFVAHAGEVAFQKVKHLTELAGVDVILVHREVRARPQGGVPGLPQRRGRRREALKRRALSRPCRSARRPG
nr:DUF2652 domain-containing protein [Corallococcus sp. AS-1-12]